MRISRPLAALATLLALASSLLLAGCATEGGAVAAGEAPAAQPKILKATGYGTAIRDNAQFSASQQKLMAIRAAKVDAYRGLAEQLYGLRIRGSTASGAFVTQNDTLRTYVEGFIRGATVTSVKPMPDGTVEVNMELEVPAGFVPHPPEREATAVLPSLAPPCTGKNCPPEARN